MLAAAVLGSAVAAIDSTVVGIALPAIGRNFALPVSSLQWVVTAYLVALAGLLLVGGALGDRYGRRRIFVIGVVWFALSSLICALAPDAGVLIAGRALQGVGGALLTPGSLAILQASFTPDDRPRAIGAWSGLGGVATAIGPFAGGFLISAVSWRLIFLINLPLAVVVVADRHAPRPRDARPRRDRARRRAGGGARHRRARSGWRAGSSRPRATAGPRPWSSGHARRRRRGVRRLPRGRAARAPSHAAPRHLPVAAVQRDQRRDLRGLRRAGRCPVPPSGAAAAGVALLARSRRGASLLPLTAVMLALSARSGALAARIGPRLQMAVGPVVVGAGMVLLRLIGPSGDYVTEVLPGVLVLALGLVITVAPLTSTALSSAPVEHAGVASAVNNDVARAGGLIAVALLPALSGLSGHSYLHPAGFEAGFRHAVVIAGVAAALGGLLAAAPGAEPAPGERTAGPDRGPAVGVLPARGHAPGPRRAGSRWERT